MQGGSKRGSVHTVSAGKGNPELSARSPTAFRPLRPVLDNGFGPGCVIGTPLHLPNPKWRKQIEDRQERRAA